MRRDAGPTGADTIGPEGTRLPRATRLERFPPANLLGLCTNPHTAGSRPSLTDCWQKISTSRTACRSGSDNTLGIATAWLSNKVFKEHAALRIKVASR